jgi:hypothetical protein
MLSFTVNRDDVNLTTDLVVHAQLGGTATLNYDYTATGFESIAGSVLQIRIPANSNSQQIVCTPVAGLVQPALTISIAIVADPLGLIIDSAHPSAIGTLTFVSDGGGGYGYGDTV